VLQVLRRQVHAVGDQHDVTNMRHSHPLTHDRPLTRLPHTNKMVSPHSQILERVNDVKTSSAPEPAILLHMNRSTVVCSYDKSHQTVYPQQKPLYADSA
jgi:hypothetical protein